MSPYNTPVVISKYGVSLSGDLTIDLDSTISVGVLYAKRIFFTLCIESNYLAKSTNNSVAGRFFIFLLQLYVGLSIFFL